MCLNIGIITGITGSSKSFSFSSVYLSVSSGKRYKQPGIKTVEFEKESMYGLHPNMEEIYECLKHSKIIAILKLKNETLVSFEKSNLNSSSLLIATPYHSLSPIGSPITHYLLLTGILGDCEYLYRKVIDIYEYFRRYYDSIPSTRYLVNEISKSLIKTAYDPTKRPLVIQGYIMSKYSNETVYEIYPSGLFAEVNLSVCGGVTSNQRMPAIITDKYNMNITIEQAQTLVNEIMLNRRNASNDVRFNEDSSFGFETISLATI